MKKLLVALLAVLMIATLAVTASAELYNPDYYGVLKVDAGSITVDGAVDAAYGEPIFYFVADGTDEPGDYTNSANWFFTKDTSENLDDVLALVQITENYAKGYAVWTDTALYVCVDTYILGYNYPVALPAGQMWKAFCVQLGIFNWKDNWNADWGLGIDEEGNVKQTYFGQNKGTGTPLLVNNADGETELNAVAIREDSFHIIYEVELDYAKVLGFTPKEGDSIGLDVCVDFGEALENADGTWGTVQKCLTFTNGGYHGRNSATARPLYFVTNKDDAVALQADKVNAGEVAPDADGYSISLFGCNDTPTTGNWMLDELEKTGGLGSYLLYVEGGKDTVNPIAFEAVDGTGYDTLEFDMYVTDPAIFDAAHKSATLELTSSGKEDAEEMSWSLAQIKELNQGAAIVAGWNHIVLPIKADCGINMANVNFIRFFILEPAVEGKTAIAFDNFRLSRAQAILTEEAQEDAAKAEKKINDLDEVTAENYTKMEIKVRGARATYDGLSDLAKGFVAAETLAKLEAAEAAIVNFKENPPADDEGEGDDEGDTTGTPDDTTDDTTGTTDTPATTDDEEGGMSMGLIIGIVVGAVVVIAVIVVIVVTSKKKKA